MIISLFTPTHNPTHLVELHQSLLRQKGGVHWEWIIVPNKLKQPIPDSVLKDPHVKVYPSELSGIGALKQFACSKCAGDVLLEVDHDDWLAEGTFAELAKAFAVSPRGFYYSDFVNVYPSGKCQSFAGIFGWESYPTEIDGKSFTACRAFPPTARSLSQIYYAPNHLRAWSRTAYDLSGGHDPDLPVADDHDLLCRTFINGTPFVHIPKPLYVYRLWPNNTYVKYGKEIKRRQNDIFNRYLLTLAFAESKRNNLAVVDVSDKHLCMVGHESCDLIRLMDGEPGFKLPYADNSVGMLRAVDTLHSIYPGRIVDAFNEMYRVLAPGGWLMTSTARLPGSPSTWDVSSFDPFVIRAKSDPRSAAQFQLVRSWESVPKDQSFQYTHVDLAAIKGQRQPGRHGWR